MYLFKFFIGSIFRLIGLVLILFYMRMLLKNLMNITPSNVFALFPILIFIFITFVIIILIVKGLINIFTQLKKENFLSKYNFPPKLYLMLEKKFPNLEKNEIEEIISLLRDYFGFLLNREKYQKTTIPSFAVGFAYKNFMELEEYGVFLKKLFGKSIPSIPLFSLDNHNYESKPLAIEHQDRSTIELWCYFADKEWLDPYCPNRLPSIFQIDDKLKIPLGFSYTFNEYKLIPTIPLSYAPSPYILKKEIIEMTNILRVAKKIQHLLGAYEYCKEYERKEIESLFAIIDNNKLLSRAVYGKYGNSNLKKYALKSAKVEEEITGCCSSGAS